MFPQSCTAHDAIHQMTTASRLRHFVKRPQRHHSLESLAGLHIVPDALSNLDGLRTQSRIDFKRFEGSVELGGDCFVRAGDGLTRSGRFAEGMAGPNLDELDGVPEQGQLVRNVALVPAGRPDYYSSVVF